jgi:hypothetical protein
LKFVPKFWEYSSSSFKKIFSLLIKILVFSEGYNRVGESGDFVFYRSIGAVKKSFCFSNYHTWFARSGATDVSVCRCALYAVLISLPTVAMNTLIAVLIFAPCMGRDIGTFLNGMVRVLARTETKTKRVV